MFNFKMDEEFFAGMQRILPGFGDESFVLLPQEKFESILQNVLPNFNSKINNIEDFCDTTLFACFDNKKIKLEDIKLVILSFIFGSYGCTINLDFAERMSAVLLNVANSYSPKKYSIIDKEYTYWLSQMGIVFILLGTVYSYKKEDIKAAYYFMRGLKTNAVSLNMPYCDFIYYILQKLNQKQKQEATYSGYGFDAENPMGSICGNILIAKKSLEIISEMEGLNGEVIVGQLGRSHTYGHLERLGSTRNSKGQMIDIYETYVINRDFNLYKVELFFNGYFSGGLTETIRIAKGFKLKDNSLKNLYYTVLD